jgi:hypothetical protein
MSAYAMAVMFYGAPLQMMAAFNPFFYVWCANGQG